MLGGGFVITASQGSLLSDLKQESVFLGKAQSPGAGPGGSQNQRMFINDVSP